MPIAPPPLAACSVCQTTLDPNGTCPRCRAPEDWNDRIEALDFLLRRLKDWHRDGQLTDRQLHTLEDSYVKERQSMAAASAARERCPSDETFPPRDECWSCKEYLYTNSSHCGECGAPITHPAVRSLRYYRYLYLEIQRHEETGWLTLRQTHEFLTDTKERIHALKTRLERERAAKVVMLGDEPPPRRRRPSQSDAEQPVVDEGPRRTLIEILVDPQSIQWLLGAGGALIVLGLVIWLSSIGLFKEPGFVALALGLGNAALLAGGWAMILRTRYQQTGRALTLLACLVMPLNLWFYHSNKLITLEDHLWVAALFCCLIYAVSAYILKDALFVYVLVGGVTLTGLLLLAQFNRFGEIAAPVTLLIVLGLVCLHAERAFPDTDSPFSRKNFGMAFYWASQPLFAVGLLLLLGAQLAGMLHGPFFRHILPREIPDVAKREFLPWTLALTLAGTYAYVYADIVVRRIGVYLYFAAITFIWAEIQVLVLTGFAHQEVIVIITLALTALAINLLQVQFQSQREFLRVVPPIGVLLSMIPVLFGVLLHFRAVNVALRNEWMVVNEAGQAVPFDVSWGLVIAMAVVALCCRAGAFLYRHTLTEVSVFYFFLTGAATLVFAVELLWMIDLKRWEVEAPLVMLIPIAYLVASYLYRGHSPEQPLIWIAHTATAIMLVCSLWVASGISRQVVELIQPIQGETRNLLLALFCLEAAVFYALASFLRRSNWTMYFAAVMLCGAIWQLLKFLHTPDEYYTVAFALTGFVLLIVYRIGVFERFAMPGLERAAFQSANALTTLGFAGGALLSLSRVFLPDHQLNLMDAVRRDVPVGDWHNPIRILLYLLIFLTIISLLSAWLVRDPVWRRVHLVLTVINALLLFAMLHRLSLLTGWQKFEIFSIVVGLLILGIGHYGWYRESDERSSDLVGLALLGGSLCLVVPLFIASAIHRFGFTISTLDELGLVAACVILFGSGVVCRLKATTLVGAIAMLCYILMVFIYIHRFLKESYIIGIYLFLGGVLLFGAGLVLSMFRDRLLALPERIKRREGIFRIFDWR